MGKISTPGEQVTSVCTNYQELLQSENFDRILRIVLRKIPVFQTEVILGYFEKLKTGEPLSEQEKVNLISFAENKNVEEAFKGLLGSFEKPLDSKVEDETKQKAFSKFLKEIFGENGFETARVGIAQIAGLTGLEVKQALELTPQQKAFQTWLAENSKYAETHNIANNVKVLKDRVEFTDKNGEKLSLPFGQIHNQTFADVENRPDAENINIENFGRIINILGGRFQYSNAGGIKLASFLHDVLLWDYRTFTWTSSRYGSDFAWRLSLDEFGVDVDTSHQDGIGAAVSFQNL